MRLDPRAFAYAVAAVWGAAVLTIGLVNAAHPLYGVAFLGGLQSLCPGYKSGQGFGGVLTATGYAMAYGGIFGWALAWLYNRVAK